MNTLSATIRTRHRRSANIFATTPRPAATRPAIAEHAYGKSPATSPAETLLSNTARTMGAVSVLHVVPAHVVRFAHNHETTGAHVAAAAATPGISPDIADAFGSAGAVFAAAVGALEAAIAAAGADVAAQHRQMGRALRDTVALIESTDAAGGARFSCPSANGG